MDGNFLPGVKRGGVLVPNLPADPLWLLVNIQNVGSRNQGPILPKEIRGGNLSESTNLPGPCKCEGGVLAWFLGGPPSVSRPRTTPRLRSNSRPIYVWLTAHK
uniref:Uncharacterized protein n=1 Tax=Knipowitschia caucasica TaxID=637954 RepID=A0AAV2L0U0_KNICA